MPRANWKLTCALARRFRRRQFQQTIHNILYSNYLQTSRGRTMSFGTSFATHYHEHESPCARELTMTTKYFGSAEQVGVSEGAFVGRWAAETKVFRLVIALCVTALVGAPVVLGWTAAMLL